MHGNSFRVREGKYLYRISAPVKTIGVDYGCCPKIRQPVAQFSELIFCLRGTQEKGCGSASPSRRVRGGRSNVSGRYPSQKMGLTIQFESHRVELAGFAYLSPW